MRTGGGRLAAAALAGLVAAGACSGSHRRATTPTSAPPPTAAPAPASPPAPVAELSVGLASAPPGNWNVLAAGGATDAVTQVADQVWPSAFDVGPSYLPVLDAALLDSAVVTSTDPQVVTYRINPRAVWSDGVAITGADFVYNWQAQSGSGRWTDVGGAPFTPASTAGYRLIGSVSFDPSQPDVVAVRFSRPDADWQALFAHLVPAHVASRVGFDRGFADPVADLVSGGPFVVQSFSPPSGLRLARNPTYAGAQAGALSLDFRFVPYVPQLEGALAAGQVSCAEVPATVGVLSQLRAVRTLAVRVGPGSAYLDLDFRERGGPLASAFLRAEVSRAVDRQAVVAAAVGSVLPSAGPIDNRLLAPGQAGYVAQAPSEAPVTSIIYRGAPLWLDTGTDTTSLAAAAVVAAELRAAGVSVSEHRVASVPGAGGWDLAVEVRAITPFPTDALDAYVAGSAGDVDGFTSPAVSALVSEASRTSGSARAATINAVDRAAWDEHVDLPLVALPLATACQSRVVGAGPNPAPEGLAYNASGWGLSGGGT